MAANDPGETPKFVQRVALAYGQQLHRFLVKRLRAGEDAGDLAQEVYLRLLRLHRSDLVRQPVAYVYFLASQVVGEHRLRESKRPLIYDSDLLEHLDNQGAVTASDELLDHEHTERLLTRLLAKLSTAHRAVYLMRKRDGFSTQEIAEKLQMSHFKVKRYLVEAQAKLESEAKPARGPVK